MNSSVTINACLLKQLPSFLFVLQYVSMIERPHPADLGRLVRAYAFISSRFLDSRGSTIDNQGVSVKQIAVFSSADIGPPFSKVGTLRDVRRARGAL